jgi:hypothetical protein
MRWIVVALALVALTSCGGSGGRISGSASGPIGSACVSAGRSAASGALCSCVQGAANQTLSASDQARAAEFFAEPEKAQSTRMSDASTSEAFWERYRNFVSMAEAMCKF